MFEISNWNFYDRHWNEYVWFTHLLMRMHGHPTNTTITHSCVMWNCTETEIAIRTVIIHAITIHRNEFRWKTDWCKMYELRNGQCEHLNWYMQTMQQFVDSEVIASFPHVIEFWGAFVMFNFCLFWEPNEVEYQHYIDRYPVAYLINFLFRSFIQFPLWPISNPRYHSWWEQHRDSCNTILIDIHLRYSFERENLIILFRIYLMSFSLNVKDFFQTIFQSSIKRIVCITLKRKDG